MSEKSNVGKHSVTKKTSNKNQFIFFIISLIVIIGILLFIFRNQIFTDNQKSFFNNAPEQNMKDTSFTKNVETYGKVENFEALEITSFTIENISSTQTKISIFLNNTSPEDIENPEFTISLVDTNGNEIASFDSISSTILANASKKIIINTEKDLSLATDLSIKIKRNVIEQTTFLFL